MVVGGRGHVWLSGIKRKRVEYFLIIIYAAVSSKMVQRLGLRQDDIIWFDDRRPPCSSNKK